MPRIGGSPRSNMNYAPDQQFDGEEFVPRGDVVVDLDDYREPAPKDYELKDGEAVELEEEDRPTGELSSGDFRKNLALDFDDKFLDNLGEEIVEQLEGDIEERRPWRDRFERGMEMMGLVESDIDDGPFPGASNAVHPLLIEARTQFWARALGELWPPDGPAKGKVMGAQTEQLNQRAARVSEYMNFDLTVQDEAYMDEMSSMTWDLPFYGSCFDKTFNDPILNQNVTIYVPADDMIVPAEARSLRTTPRFAHRMRKWPNEVKQLQIAGHYRDCQLELPSGSEEDDEIERIKNETQDVEPDGDDNSVRHELFETCINRILPGDEHKDDEGNDTGLERSYYITVDRHTRKVLSIYRGWDESDVTCRRKLYVNHWKYAPGEGFYGSGLFHLIGGLQIAATGALRVLLDSAASASLSGGFVSRHANLKGKSLVLTPGQWQVVDAAPEDLAKAFFAPPVKEPSAALFQLLGFLTERGEKFSATTELMSGDSDPKGSPVGTTQMMIEQGGKVMSAIHRMMHTVLGRQLRIRYQLMREFAPPDGYPYEVGDGQQRTVWSDDFAPGVSIVPVSDPNVFSSAQRMAQNQALYQIAMETGALPMQKVVRRMLEGMRIPDIDELIPAEVKPMSYDPAGEIQALLMGKPIQVLPEQMHVMHLRVLGAFAQNPEYAGNEAVMKNIGPNLLALMGQHMAYAWTTHMRGMGVPSGYMDPQSGKVMGSGTPEQIAAVLASVAPRLATVPGMPAIDPEGGSEDSDKETDAKIRLEYAKLELKKAEMAQNLEQDKQKHQFEIQALKEKTEAQKQMNQAKVQIAMQKGQQDLQVAQQKAQVDMQTAQMDGQIKQQQAATQAQQAEQQAAQQQHMDERQMQRDEHMANQEMQHKEREGQQKLRIGEQQGQQKLQQDKLSSLRGPAGGGQGGGGMPGG